MKSAQERGASRSFNSLHSFGGAASGENLGASSTSFYEAADIHEGGEAGGNGLGVAVRPEADSETGSNTPPPNRASRVSVRTDASDWGRDTPSAGEREAGGGGGGRSR